MTWVWMSPNSDAIKVFARLQYGHQVFEKMVMVLPEMAF